METGCWNTPTTEMTPPGAEMATALLSVSCLPTASTT